MDGIWIWPWAEPKDDPISAKFQAWDFRLDYGDKRWTACTVEVPTKIADLPRGF